MGQMVTESGPERPDPKAGFRLVQDEEAAAVPPSPVPLPQGAGNPPEKPPAAPPAAAEPEPKRLNTFEIKIKQLNDENQQLLCAVYWLQEQLKELRSPK
jgi:hypothetical protein